MLECKKLTVKYQSLEVLHGIDWKMEEHLLTAVVGPNGSGKSTLLKAILGYVNSSGEIWLENKNIQEWESRELAQRIAYLPQSRSDSNLPVGKMVLHGRFPHLSYPRHYSQEDEQKVTWALQKMGIEKFRHKPMAQLSGGEKQKSYLAMALTQDTPTLFLDEPTVYLDLPWQLELMELLKGLRDEGKTIVTVLHDLNHALQYADRLLVMQDGNLKQYGTPEEILKSGVLEEVFGLNISPVTDRDGRQQYCFSGQQSKK